MDEGKLVSADSHVNKPGDPWVERIDWDQAHASSRFMQTTPLTLKPSEYFHRQVYATFIDDAVGVENRH